MFTPQEITDAANKFGLDPELVNTVVGIESSHGANVLNPKSPSNTGLFQMAPANQPGGANDTKENQLQFGMQALKQEKANLEQRLGRPATNAEVYLAHQQGAAGAAALINNPDTPAGQVTRSINISNNQGDPNATAGDFVKHWGERYAHFSGPYAAMKPSTASTTTTAAAGDGQPAPASTTPAAPVATTPQRAALPSATLPNWYGGEPLNIPALSSGGGTPLATPQAAALTPPGTPAGPMVSSSTQPVWNGSAFVPVLRPPAPGPQAALATPPASQLAALNLPLGPNAGLFNA
jgi:hypothetical protein